MDDKLFDYFDQAENGTNHKEVLFMEDHFEFEAGKTIAVTEKRKRGGLARGVKAVALCMAAVLTVTCLGTGIGVGGKLASHYLTYGTLSVNSAAVDTQLTTTAQNMSYSQSLLASSYANTSIIDVVKGTANSVVSINVSSTYTTNNAFFGPSSRTVESAGSGVIFFEDYEKVYILTNYHVIEGADAVTISIDDEKQAPAHYLGCDKSADLAVIYVYKSDLQPAGISDYTIAVFGDSDKLEVGETVVAIGNALGEGKSATAGIVSALNKKVTIDSVTYEAIQTDATINPGNSGGALVNTSSQVIGINSAKISGSGVEGTGYSIPSNTVKQIIDQIMNGGSPQKPYLGISGMTITEEIKAANSIIPALGVYISSVQSGGGAEKAGLRSTDIIVGVNGSTITTFEELSAEIVRVGVGGKLLLDIYRTDNYRNYTERTTLEAIVGDMNAGANF